MYAKIDLEKFKDEKVYHHGELALPVARMVSRLPHNTDDSAIHKCNYKALEVKVQSFCVVNVDEVNLQIYLRGVGVDAYRRLVLDFSPECFGGGAIRRWGALSEKSEFEKTTICLPCS